MIRLLSLAFAFICFLIGAVFLVNALMVTFDTVFASRDACLALVFVLTALLAVKAGETAQFAYDDWSTRKMQAALGAPEVKAEYDNKKQWWHQAGVLTFSQLENEDWSNVEVVWHDLNGVETDTQELPRVG